MMKRMKRLLPLLAGAALLLSACGQAPAPVTPDTPDTPEDPPAATEPEEKNVMTEVPNGNEAAADLDGDGTAETVTVTLADVDATNLTSFQVNGQEYADTVLNDLGVYVVLGDLDHYYITDLDTSDGKLEIAVLDYGPSEDPETYFFRYDGGALTYIGSISDRVCQPEVVLTGDGTVSGRGRFQLLQTWFGQFTWRLNDAGALEVVPQVYTFPAEFGGSEQPVTQIEDLTLYQDMDLASGTEAAPAADCEVVFTATDNEHWVQLTRADGLSGWFYLEEFDRIQDPERGELFAEEVFDGLCMAD